MSHDPVECAFLGGLSQDYYITHDGEIFLGVLGGEAVYAAAGASLWSAHCRIFSRVGSDFPREWLDKIAGAGIDVDGVRVLPDAHETRRFFVYSSPEQRADVSPAAQFLRMNAPLPKELIGFDPVARRRIEGETYAPLAIHPSDIHEAAQTMDGALLCPGEYLSHSLLPARLRELGVDTVVLDPSPAYMEPGFIREIPSLLDGITAFLPNDEEARSLFRPAGKGNLEMAQSLCDMGCRFGVIKCGAGGVCAVDGRTGDRWIVPAYPVRLRDVTGAGGAFDGGFLAGLALTGDLVEACLRGAVSASFAVEGRGALYAVDAHPHLPTARLDALRARVTRA
jgi:sugar/nucleoside kinase (ribokinase family)